MYTIAQKRFWKFTSCRTFGAHKLVHSEPFLNYQYEVWQLLSALWTDMWNFFIYVHIYILGPKLLRWNFLQISQLSTRNGAHKLIRRFLDFSQFLTAIAQPLWRHPATKMRKNNQFWKNRWKPHQNQPINNTSLDYVPTLTHTKREIQKNTPIFAPTAGARSISPDLCIQIENVVTNSKSVNRFSIQCTVFNSGAKMLIFGHWRTE